MRISLLAKSHTTNKIMNANLSLTTTPRRKNSSKNKVLFTSTGLMARVARDGFEVF